MSDVTKHIESIYREKFGQLISMILQRFPGLAIESVEDIVQETFAEAQTRWPKQGLPENPSGWLYKTCKNKSINLLKKNSATENLSFAENIAVDEEEITEHGFKDAQLLMLVA